MSRETFHDLHQDNLVDPQHIRLISEGGSSLSHSNRPVCIDSIQVSQSCTSESQHAAYRPTTGARSMSSHSGNALFSVPAEHAEELDRGSLPAVLLARFGQQGVIISKSAQLTIERPGRTWCIEDQGDRFSVRKLAAHLAVYRDSE